MGKKLMSVAGLAVWSHCLFATPVDQVALRMCKGVGNLETVCLGVIKDATFSTDVLKVCDDLRYPSATVKCLQLVAGESFDQSLLKACDEMRSDWDVIDCLKSISHKTSEQLSWRITAGQFDPLWVINYGSAQNAWNALWQSLAARVIQCNGYRHIEPVDKNWKYDDCWSTRFDFSSGPPDSTLGPKYPVGSAGYSHCLVSYHCVTE